MLPKRVKNDERGGSGADFSASDSVRSCVFFSCIDAPCEGECGVGDSAVDDSVRCDFSAPEVAESTAKSKLLNISARSAACIAKDGWSNCASNGIAEVDGTGVVESGSVISNSASITDVVVLGA